MTTVGPATETDATSRPEVERRSTAANMTSLMTSLLFVEPKNSSSGLM